MRVFRAPYPAPPRTQRRCPTCGRRLREGQYQAAVRRGDMCCQCADAIEKPAEREVQHAS